MTPLYAVPTLWPNSTVVCLGTGPSLTQADVDACRGQHVIAVNDAYTLAPWADVLYAADNKWWHWHRGAPDFAGLKYTIEDRPYQYVVQPLQNTGPYGLELAPTGLRTGFNSGYQAINLAVHFGAKRIVLLGFDLKGRHFFPDHPLRRNPGPPFAACLMAFPTLVGPLKTAGVEVVNCSPDSAIECFPKLALADALQAAVAI